MKKLVLLSLTLACLSLTAQSVPCNIAGSFTATGDSIVLDNTRLGCYQWRVAYTSTGFSGVSISLQSANSFNGSFADFSGATVVTDGTNPSTATTHAIIGIHSNGAFVKIHLGTATGSGTVIYQVWGANSTTSSSSSLITGTSPIVVAGNNVSCPTCGTSSGTVTGVTATLPLTSSGGTAPVIGATYQGNGLKVQASTGSTVTNDCVKFDANGNTIDFGAPCGGGVVVLGADIPVTGTQSLPSGSTTALLYTTAVNDDGGYSGVTSNALVVPTGKGGWYTISANIDIPSGVSPGSFIGLNLNNNGTTICRVQFAQVGTGFTSLAVPRVIKLAVGDTITASVFQNSGLTVTVSTGNLSLTFVN